MITVRAPLPGEIEAIGKSAAEKWVRDAFNTGADFSALFDRERTEVAFIDGRPVAAGGFIPQGDCAVAWSLVGAIPREHFVGICRLFRRRIAATPFRLIEAHCFETFTQSHRWVKCLGFEPIHEPAQYAPDGRRFMRFIFRNDPHGN